MKLKMSLAAGSLLMLVSLACNALLPARPVEIPTATPDFTMTAIVTNLQASPIPPLPAAPTATIPLPTVAVMGGAVSPTPVTFPTVTPPPPLPPTATFPPPTPIPPPTWTPVTSYAGPAMRSGVSIVAARRSPPTIDGYLTDWSETIYPASYPVYGADAISNADDLSSKVMVAWDDHYLYIGARVDDDAYIQNATGKYLYRGDSVEVLLDTNVAGDFYYDVLSPDDYQLGVSPGNPTRGVNTEAYLWYPSSLAGPVTSVQIGVLSLPGGYHLELAIPWSLFNVTPFVGQHFGFAFSVSDNDTGSQNVQQSMVSSVPTRVLTRPTTWGDLTLGP